MVILTTLEAYNDAIKSIKAGSDIDFDPEQESIDHGWKVRVECIAKARKVKHYLYISNDRFGFNEAELSMTQWKRIEAMYLSTYVKNHKFHDHTHENVKTCLSLLLIYCTPKNVSDYPNSIQDKWIRLGYYFCHDLFYTVKNAVDESDWVDWVPFWRKEYYKLKRIIEMGGGKVLEAGAGWETTAK